jgi:hypothetical protein
MELRADCSEAFISVKTFVRPMAINPALSYYVTP